MLLDYCIIPTDTIARRTDIMQKTIYEHYFRGLESDFSKETFKPIKNIKFVKPEGGFWASATNANYGWKQWCNDECESWAEGIPFKFALKDDSKILYIHDIADIPVADYTTVHEIVDTPFTEDIKNQINADNNAFLLPRIHFDFEELSKKYDGIEIDAGSNPKLYYAFYGWDCDSICIFNPDIIMEVE